MLIGHVAVSILTHRYLGTEVAPTLLGGLFPDIVDKTLCQVLHVTPNGRMWGHTLLGLTTSTSLIWLLAGKDTAHAWALGYAGHFLADSPLSLPLAYPFKDYNFSPSPGFREILQRFLDQRGEVALELGLLVIALIVAARSSSDRARLGG
jgi:hypothetical protein